MEAQPSREQVENAIRELEVQAVSFGYRFIVDANVRQAYMAQTKSM